MHRKRTRHIWHIALRPPLVASDPPLPTNLPRWPFNLFLSLQSVVYSLLISTANSNRRHCLWVGAFSPSCTENIPETTILRNLNLPRMVHSCFSLLKLSLLKVLKDNFYKFCFQSISFFKKH